MLLVVFVALIVGPAVAGKMIPDSLTSSLSDIAGFRLMQPNDLKNDNTNASSQTGTGMAGYSGAGKTSSATSSSGSTAKIKLF